MKADAEYDVIVAGAGAGGMTAASVAAAEGLKVLVIEKSSLVGGTTAVSGGMVWIPGSAGRGGADGIEAARIYLRHTVHGTFNENLRSRFLARGSEAIAYLEAKTSVRFRPAKDYPDYYPDLPGASLTGRALEPVPFDAKALGRRFIVLRPPPPELLLLGGMMIDRADIAHFRKAARSMRSAARVAWLVARYGIERLSTERGTSLHLGNALAARLHHSLLELGVEIAFNTQVREFVWEAAQSACVVAQDPEGFHLIRARRAVVLATGGFSHDAALRSQYLPAGAGRLSAACPTNTGDGIRIAIGVGGALCDQNEDNAFWAPLSCFKRPDGAEACFPHTVSDRSKPGLIAVGTSGRRFTNEARSYHEFVRAMFRSGDENPAIPAYLICDRTFLWKYGLGAVKPFSLSLRAWRKSGYLHRGKTLRALARAIGVNPATLEATVTRFNQDAQMGIDRDFGRGGDAYQRYLGDADHALNSCVAPIEKPPFYAVAVYPGDIGTAAGLVTDEHARVLDHSGQPISKLYACGNDMQSVMNGAYPGPGITLGPALTFGYLAARHIAGSV
jgi:succinate dehydrogenase/fumarate reductase flavoprotein subunit